MSDPKRYRIRLTPEALSNLEEIHAHIAKDSPRNAAGMLETILDAIDLLEIFPLHKLVEPQSRTNKHPVRTLPVPPYIIYFRVIDDEAVVVIRHIRHGARQTPDIEQI